MTLMGAVLIPGRVEISVCAWLNLTSTILYEIKI